MSVNEEIEELKRSVRRLEDIHEIQQLKYRYLRCMDTGNHEELATLFHPDVVVDVVGGSYHIQLNGRDAYVNFIRENIHAGIVAMHHGHHPEIEILSDTTAHARWYLEDIFIDLEQKTRMQGSLIYDDDYVKVGQWLLKSTSYYRVFEIVEKLDDISLTAHLLAEKGFKHPPGKAKPLSQL